jgi:molybdopterin-containing oxidoreductase family molybdopterin binding subunit
MRRVGERGAGEWERIEWDEAIQTITDKWKEYIAEYGPSSIVTASGTGNSSIAFGIGGGGGYFKRFENVMNSTVAFWTYDNAASAHGMTGVNTLCVPDTLKDAGCIVVWSFNASESSIQSFHFMTEAVQSGTKLIVIDPNYTITASKADLWVPIRPGTDGALALTLTKLAIDRDLVDWEVIKTKTQAPFLIKENGSFLKLSDIQEVAADGTDEPLVVDKTGNPVPASTAVDPTLTGVTEAAGFKVKTVFDALDERLEEWTLERCAEVCDISVDLIEEILTISLENRPVHHSMGLGIDHYENGYITYIAMDILIAFLGDLFVPGGGIDNLQNGVILLYLFNYAPLYPTGLPTSTTIPFPRLPEILETGKYGDQDLTIKSLFLTYHNAVGNQTGRKEIIAAFDKIDLVIVSDMIETDTTRYADIVLPCAHWFEQEDITIGISPFLTIQEKAIEPLFEAKEDYEIINLLAQGMDLKGFIPESREKFMRDVLDSDFYNAFGMDYDRLKSEKILAFHGLEASMLADPTARISLYWDKETLMTSNPTYYDYGQEVDWKLNSLPYWEPPPEAWAQTVGEFEKKELSAKYPLIYTTYRNKMKDHTIFGYNPWLLEIFPEPTVMMNTADTEARGIAHGDLVRIFNDRGEVVARAVRNDGIRPGMVVLPKGWQEDQFIEGHYSDLTSRHMNPVCANNYFFDSLCEIELYEGGH